MDPVHIYWVMMATVALPCAIVSIAARLVVAVFVGAWLALWAGFDLQQSYLALHAFAFGAGIFGCRTWRGRVAVALFLPLAIVDRQTIIGTVTTDQWWWAVYWLAMAQAALLPLTIKPVEIRAAIARLFYKAEGAQRMEFST
jgi:hypothetical protein